jgi:hypothetical protein
MNLKQIDLRLVLLFVIIGLIFILAQECNRNVDLNNTLTNLNNNVNALRDTISVSKNEIGKIQYEKSILVSSETGLRDLNSRLYREMQNTKSQVAQLIEVVSNLSTPPPPPTPGVGTTVGEPCDTAGGAFTVVWDGSQTFDSLNYRKLRTKTMIGVKKGVITGNLVEVLEDNVNFNLITKLEKRKDHYEIVVRSDYPGFKPSKIDGAIIPRSDLFPPEKRKNFSVGIGPQIGWGIGGTTGIAPVWYIGLGASVQYTIFKF